ncbi:cadherin-like beta sandwich domain-containing protein [Paenibacillus sp. Marseille-Q4541]|uniref:cadherin-like beta sandwich domain-containing protein n=1 Tax=Paenibacillus sp. Marseille-Q4541 TaxID=2831522 RepID=UPI001BACCEA1|nr:cadherin-like beta sandwich domain-containing protein [Paenibacillus sp. Marseille-Q4541]
MKIKKLLSPCMAGIIAFSAMSSTEAMYTEHAQAAQVTTAVDKPVSSKPSGRYEQSVTITLNSSTPGATIYYTLDGTLPDEMSLKYNGTPIVLTDSTNVSVRALKDGVWSVAGTYGYIIKSTEKPLLQVVAMSDIHMGSSNGDPQGNSAEALAKVRARYTSNFDVISSIFKNPDAIVIAGDAINDNGDSLGANHSIVTNIFKEQLARTNMTNTRVQFAMGNHDDKVSTAINNYPPEWFTTQPNGYYEQTIGGYSFFFLNGNNYNNDTEQRNWLKSRLATITSDAANKNKPIFITLHHPVTGTVMDGQQTSNPNLYKDLQDYPEVIVLSGHSHLNINDDRSIHQKDFTSINLGSMSYIEVDHGYSAITDEGLVDGRFEFPVNQAQFIEVYADRIEIDRVEFNGDSSSIYSGGKWQGPTDAPFNSAGALAGKKWVVKLQGNTMEEIKDNFTYTSNNRNKTAPQFPVNPELQVKAGANDTPVLAFRQANDDQSMHHYEIKVSNKRTGSIAKTYNVLSDYYFSPIPNRMNIPMTGLDAATSYFVTITAVDAYGNKSAALQTSFVTGGTPPELTPIDPATMWNLLVSDMKFDDNLNDTAAGVTGLATKSGSVSFVDGKSGKAISIPAGNSNYVDLGDRQDLKFGSGNFTVSFMHMGNLAGDQTVLSNKDWNSGANVGWYIGPATANHLTLNMASNGKRIDYSATSVGTEWHHITVSVDRENNAATTYVDGIAKATKDISTLGTGSMDTPYNIILGADGRKANGGANVTLDDLKIWKRALSATEAKALSDSYKMDTMYYTYDQLTAKIAEADKFISYISATTGVSLPAQEKDELERKLTAAKSLSSGDDAAIIDQSYVELMWELQAAKEAVVYSFIPKTGFTIDSFSSYADNEDAIAANILDGDQTTIWHSKWEAPVPDFPHWVIIDMKASYQLNGIQRTSRPNQSAMEFPKGFELYASDKLTDLSDPTFLDDESNKVSGVFSKTWTGSVYKDFVALDRNVQGRYVKFLVTGTYNTDTTKKFTSMSEIDFTGEKMASPSVQLLDLQVNGTTVADFAPDKLEYSLYVPNTTTSVEITYTAEHEDTSVIVTGGTDLKVGDNVVSVVVTALDGNSKTYVIHVHRTEAPLPSDASLLQLNVNGKAITDFAPDKLDYELKVPYETSVTTVTYEAADPAAVVEIVGGDKLVVGENPITVTVTAQDGITKLIYNVLITRQPEAILSNANLSDLRINGTTVAHFAPDKLDYTLNVSNDVSVAQVTYVAEDPAATVHITGGPELRVGDNRISVLITAQDNSTTKEYVVNVNRDKPSSETSPGESTGDPSGGSSVIPPLVPPVKPELPSDAIAIEDKDLNTDSPSVSIKLTEGINRVMIPVSQSDKLKGRTLTVQAENITLTVPAQILSALNLLLPKADESAMITVKIEPIAAELANETIQKASLTGNGSYTLGGNMFDLSIFITDASGKMYTLSSLPKPVTVSFPIPKGMNPKFAGIYQIQENGSPLYLGGKLVQDTTIQIELDHFSPYAVLSYEKTYDDVNAQHWAYDTIRELTAKHIVTGVTNSSFAPSQDVTRVEFTALIAKALGLTSSSAASPFNDVNENAWYADEVTAAYAAKIVTGASKQSFHPNRNITREEMAMMLVRAYEYQTGQVLERTPAKLLDNSKIGKQALPYVNAALHSNLLKGRQAGRFEPTALTSRAEAAQAIYNLLHSFE